MKVKRDQTIKSKLSDYIKTLPGEIVLRENLANLAGPRQISRGLKALTEAGIIIKLGYGVYAKLEKSDLLKDPFLPEGFDITAKKALDKLGVVWELSQAEQEYNVGISTQIPVVEKVVLKTRFARELSYKGRTLQFE